MSIRNKLTPPLGIDSIFLLASCLSGCDEEGDVVSSWKDLEKIAQRDKQRQRESEESKLTPPAVTTHPSSPPRQGDIEASPVRSLENSERDNQQMGIVEAGNLLMAQLTENNRAARSSLFGGRTVDLDIVVSRTTRTAGTSTDFDGDGHHSPKENKLTTTKQKSSSISVSARDKGSDENEIDSNKEVERIMRNQQMREEKKRLDREEQRRREKDLALMYMSAKAPHLSMQVLDSIDLGECLHTHSGQHLFKLASVRMTAGVVLLYQPTN